jgi:hypothetical protein
MAGGAPTWSLRASPSKADGQMRRQMQLRGLGTRRGCWLDRRRLNVPVVELSHGTTDVIDREVCFGPFACNRHSSACFGTARLLNLVLAHWIC